MLSLLYRLSLIGSLVASTAHHGHASPTSCHPSKDQPVVQVQNGTLAGVHSSGYDQDFFLGVPYAQPPIGQLRFRNPLPLNSTWIGARNAVEYSPSCVGYGADPAIFSEVKSSGHFLLSELSESQEDQYLTPSNYQNASLPVAVYIHGGGFSGGSGISQRYNMSFTVGHSKQMGQPIIGITINYRVSAWGWLQSQEVAATGERNWGLRDQRLALQWIQENIAAFGGDPNKVTIWGESAGAMSVGLHLVAYNGRDDGLFRGAIMESGTPLVTSSPLSYFQPLYDKLTGLTGCNSTSDSLGCLRSVPYDQINSVLNSSALNYGNTWWPTIDGDIISEHGSEALANGHFVKVPLLMGCNSEEGTSFTSVGLNTTEQLKESLMSGQSPMTSNIADQILQAYPFDNWEPVLKNLGPSWIPPATASYGTQYRRAATYAGDQTFIANRRLTCQTYASAGIDTFCYRFNAIPAGTSAMLGATHYTEIGFVFDNLLGVGYPPVKVPPFQGKGPEYSDLAALMNGDWVSFIHNGDPNAWDKRKDQALTMRKPVPAFPKYYDCNGTPWDFVYDANVTSFAEQDNWRSLGMDLINSLNLEVFRR